MVRSDRYRWYESDRAKRTAKPNRNSTKVVNAKAQTMSFRDVFARRRRKSTRGGLVEKPQDAAVDGLNPRGWILALRGIRDAANGVENFFFLRASGEEIGVAALIEHRKSESQAVRRRGLDGDGFNPFLFFFEHGRSRKKRRGVAFGADTEERNVK